MKRRASLALAVVLIAFTGCSLFTGNLEKKIKKAGSTVSVDKNDLDEDINTQKYGKIHFKDSQEKKIKDLKKKEQIFFCDMTATKGAKKKGENIKEVEIVVLVIRKDADSYQMFFMEKPKNLPCL